MTKLNHDRWLLKLLDNHRRETVREGIEIPAGSITPDRSDSRSPPRTSQHFSDATKNLSTVILAVIRGRNAKKRACDGVAEGKPASKRKARSFSRLQVNEESLRLISLEIIVELIGQDEDRNSQAFDWLVWWLKEMERAGNKGEPFLETLIEFWDRALDDAAKKLKITEIPRE